MRSTSFSQDLRTLDSARVMSTFSGSLSSPSAQVARSSYTSITKFNSSTVDPSRSSSPLNPTSRIPSTSSGDPLAMMGLAAATAGSGALSTGAGAGGSAIPGAMQAYKQSAPVLTETYCEICNRQFCNKVLFFIAYAPMTTFTVLQYYIEYKHLMESFHNFPAIENVTLNFGTQCRVDLPTL